MWTIKKLQCLLAALCFISTHFGWGVKQNIALIFGTDQIPNKITIDKDLLEKIPFLKKKISEKGNELSVKELLGLDLDNKDEERSARKQLLEQCLALNVKMNPTNELSLKFKESSKEKIVNWGITSDGSKIWLAIQKMAKSSDISYIVKVINTSDEKEAELTGDWSSVGVTYDKNYLILVDSSADSLFTYDIKNIKYTIEKSNSLQPKKTGTLKIMSAPDSSYFVVSGPNKLWKVNVDGSSIKELVSFSFGSTPIPFEISPDSSFIACAPHANQIQKITTKTKKEEFSFSDKREDKKLKISSVGISPNGKYLAAGCVDGKVKIWGIDNEKKDKPIAVELFEKNEPIHFIAISSDGKNIIAAHKEKKNKGEITFKTKLYYNVSEKEYQKTTINAKNLEKIVTPTASYIRFKIRDLHYIYNAENLTSIIADGIKATRMIPLSLAQNTVHFLIKRNQFSLLNPKDNSYLFKDLAIEQAHRIVIAPESAQIAILTAENAIKLLGKNLSQVATKDLLVFTILMVAKNEGKKIEDDESGLKKLRDTILHQDLKHLFGVTRQEPASQSVIAAVATIQHVYPQAPSEISTQAPINIPAIIAPAAQPQAQEIIPAPQAQPLQQTTAEPAQSSVSTEPAQQEPASQGTGQQVRQEQTTEQQAQPQKQSAVQEPASTQIPVVASTPEPQQAGWWGVIKSWISGWYTSITSWFGSWFGYTRR